jgi:2-polyprenyl-3-methyl-5-hydroxy-6-metoxy-1,4-benzoquinol methylase
MQMKHMDESFSCIARVFAYYVQKQQISFDVSNISNTTIFLFEIYLLINIMNSQTLAASTVQWLNEAKQLPKGKYTPFYSQNCTNVDLAHHVDTVDGQQMICMWAKCMHPKNFTKVLTTKADMKAAEDHYKRHNYLFSQCYRSNHYKTKFADENKAKGRKVAEEKNTTRSTYTSNRCVDKVKACTSSSHLPEECYIVPASFDSPYKQEYPILNNESHKGCTHMYRRRLCIVTVVGAISLVLMTWCSNNIRLKQALVTVADRQRVLLTPLKQTSTDAHQGNTGGDWSWCTHIVGYGYNFDEGLASFLAFQLTPASTFEFGCGIGLYCDYLVRHGKVAGKVVGAEPSDMQGAGVFGRAGIQYPQHLMMNILEATDEERSALGKFDLVYTIEVAEHVPAGLHRVMMQVLKSLTTKYLVFAAARPGQAGTGHLGRSMFTREEWKVRWESTGLFHLEGLSEMLRRQCDPYNTNHAKNILVFGVSMRLDTTVAVPELTRNVEMKKERHEANAMRLFPFMLDAKIKSRECTIEHLSERERSTWPDLSGLARQQAALLL